MPGLLPEAKPPFTYVCDDCGGTFDSGRADEEEAHVEAVENFGVRGDAPGMALVCDECYQAIMAGLSN